MADHHRLTKKQLKHDRFLQSIYSAWAYTQDHGPVVVAGAVGLIALIVLGVRVGGSVVGGNPAGDADAERALTQARVQFMSGQPDAGLGALQDLTAHYRGSRAAREGQYVLGNALYEKGDWDGARQAFEQFLKQPLHDDLMKDGARLAIAACREESGDLAGAAAGYRAVWDDAAQPGSRVQAGLGAARCALAQGHGDQALALYHAIAKDYPDSPEAEQARFRILELGG